MCGFSLNSSLAKCGFPSDTYKVIANNGTTANTPFTAPSNGYIYASGLTASTEFAALIIENTTNKFSVASHTYGDVGHIGLTVYAPVKKGQTISITRWGACSSYEARFYNVEL